MPPLPSPAIALATAMFFRMFGVFAALPVIAAFARELPGGTQAAWAIGIAVGAYGITQALCQIPAGALADRIGRKPALAAALSLFILGCLLCAAADNILTLILGRLLQGTGAVAAIAAAWIADLAPPEKRPQAMAVFGAAIALAFVVSLFTAAPLSGAVGTNGIFTVSAAAGILALLIILSLPSPPQTRPLSKQPLTATLQSKQLRTCALGAFVLHYAMATLFLQIPLALSATLPLPQHWKIYIPAFALSLVPAVPLLMKAGKTPALVFPVSIVLAAAGYAASLAGGGDIWAVGFGMFLFFSGFIVLEAALPATASLAASETARGAAIGLVMTCEFLGVFCGGAISGLLLHFLGVNAMTLAGIVLFCIWGGFWRKTG